MTQLQYRLLHSVNFSSSPVRKLTINGEDQGAWFGFRFPYKIEEIFRELFELIGNNLMALELEVDDETVEPIENPSMETLWDSLKEGRICYYLTPEGGALWEQALKVDWNKYVSTSMTRGVEARSLRMTLISPKLENLDFVLEDLFRVYDELEPEQRMIEPIQAWEVCYWKTLPTAFKTFCRVKQKPPSEIQPAASDHLRRPWYDDAPLGFSQRLL